MPTLLLRFPAGRYHATPTGHHVNEGLIEWPPSPWRLLRALLACGYTTLGWTEVPPVGRRLLETLATVVPTYRLPPASAAHSRHYMPVVAGPSQKTTLVFDTWADVGDGLASVIWDCALDDEATDLLATLAANLNYLGRSESWVEARLLGPDEGLPPGLPCEPHREGERRGPGWEQVSLIAVDAPLSFQAWRDEQVTKVLEDLPLPEGKKKIPKKLESDRAKAIAPYPLDLLDALHWDTARWKQHRWSQAPGSRRVLYWRRDDALDIARPVPARLPQARPVAGMLLALTTTSGRRGGLPTVARTLPQAELLHRALIGRLGHGERIDCPVLTGTSADGRPLRGHQHARILPVDLDGDGHLDHILITAVMGLDAQAQAAIRSLRKTHTKGADDLQVALAASVDLGDLHRLSGGPLGDGVARVLGPSRVWQSVTPFVPPRFVKQRGANTLEGQITAELASHGLPTAAIQILPFTDEQARTLRHHVRVRRDAAKAPPVDCGFYVRLTFEHPVPGPVSLGYASHFGLGLFRADQESP